MRAHAMNYRELLILRGGYVGNKKLPVIPTSDGAGEVVAIGAGVTEFQVGDRVASTFFRDWVSGPPTPATMATALGGAIDGTLAEYVAFPERGLVKVPDHLSYAEGAALTCAGLTAWNALTTGGLMPGQTILTLGTGGVSVFALQFAKLAGARVIVTSSSDEKLAKALAGGADTTINYRTHPDWHLEVLELTGGVGVDQVVELGGAGTLERSIAATRMGGYVGVIGVLTGVGPGGFTPATVFFNHLRCQGIYVGSRHMYTQMNQAVALHKLRPVIDMVIPFTAAPEAYRLLEAGTHFGKIVISHE
jgi:NADPH:quinone reductase-like Zn-dependent oxidoreductase